MGDASVKAEISYGFSDRYIKSDQVKIFFIGWHRGGS
jgi:hypothetical protein